jgi:tetratricopeptide (TPR) repeat protein
MHSMYRTPAGECILRSVDVQDWIEEGTEALAEEDFERAEEIAQRIIESRHSYGFELLARVFRDQDNLPRAIEVLQEGVSKAPRAWPLWLLLGEFRSDYGEYDLALLAYDTALGIEGVDADEVHLNAAIVHDRAGRPEDALMRLHEVRGANAETAMYAARVRAEILLETERPEAAAAAAQAGIARADDDTASDEIAPLYAAMAKAAWMKGDRSAALRYAWEAIEHHADETALWLVREVEAQYSNDAKFYRITVEGRLPPGSFEDDAPRGFIRTFEVVADDDDEALRLITRVEPEMMRNGLRARDVEVLDDASDQPKGVYWVSGHSFFPEGDEEDQ